MLWFCESGLQDRASFNEPLRQSGVPIESRSIYTCEYHAPMYNEVNQHINLDHFRLEKQTFDGTCSCNSRRTSRLPQLSNPISDQASTAQAINRLSARLIWYELSPNSHH